MTFNRDSDFDVPPRKHDLIRSKATKHPALRGGGKEWSFDKLRLDELTIPRGYHLYIEARLVSRPREALTNRTPAVITNVDSPILLDMYAVERGALVGEPPTFWLVPHELHLQLFPGLREGLGRMKRTSDSSEDYGLSGWHEPQSPLDL